MNIPHLTDEEMNSAVLGEELPAGAVEHLSTCLVCRRRRDGFLALVEEAGGGDPDEATRVRVRERALAAWSGTGRRRWVGWLAAAAAVVLLSVLPLVRSSRTTRPAGFNADVVLVEVNQVLDRDPLYAVDSEEVVNTVVTIPDEAGERSLS